MNLVESLSPLRIYLCFKHESLKLISTYNFGGLLCRMEAKIVHIIYVISGGKTRKKRKIYENKKTGEYRIWLTSSLVYKSILQWSMPFLCNSLALSFFKIYMSLGWCTWYWCKTASHWWAGHQHETGNSCQGDNRGFKRERSRAVLFSSLWSWGPWCGCWSHNPMCWETGACGAHNCVKCERNQEKPQVIIILFNV